MTAMKLYTFESFNPKKVELALYELGVDFEPIEVDLYRRQNREPAFLALNPRGKIPVLVDGDLVLSESYAIVAYLGEREGRRGGEEEGEGETLHGTSPLRVGNG